MAHPITHAESSAKRFGGIPEDYLPIHDLMDSSKEAFPDNRHRALTHNPWFFFICEKVFGHVINLTCTNCYQSKVQMICPECGGSGKKGAAKVRYVCEQHVLEDFGGKYIPTVQDYFEGMEFQEWMNNGIKGAPSSHRKLVKESPTTKRQVFRLD